MPSVYTHSHTFTPMHTQESCKSCTHTRTDILACTHKHAGVQQHCSTEIQYKRPKGPRGGLVQRQLNTNSCWAPSFSFVPEYRRTDCGLWTASGAWSIPVDPPPLRQTCDTQCACPPPPVQEKMRIVRTFNNLYIWISYATLCIPCPRSQSCMPW